MLEVENLARRFVTRQGTKTVSNEAVKGISFQVKKGEIYGFLGPNGAGKTTTIKMLATLLSPSSGTARLCGLDIQKDTSRVRERINVMFGGERGLYGRLTVREYLRYFACLYQVPSRAMKSRIEMLLASVDLVNKGDATINTLSKGMIQRVLLARSLINNPQLVFFDEPTLGLDPEVAETIRTTIRQLAQSGITIMLTTHYMREVEQLCQRLSIMADGQIQTSGSPTEIRQKHIHCDFYEAICMPVRDEVWQESNLAQNLIVQRKDGKVQQIQFEVPKGSNTQHLELELPKSWGILQLERREATLEDAYLHVIRSRKTS